MARSLFWLSDEAWKTLEPHLPHEALMGLSIEPLVYGFLSPLIKERLTPSFNPFNRLPGIWPEGRSGESNFGPRQTASAIFHNFVDPINAFLPGGNGMVD